LKYQWFFTVVETPAVFILVDTPYSFHPGWNIKLFPTWLKHQAAMVETPGSFYPGWNTKLFLIWSEH
jgi:hypothetical protein